MQVNIGWLAGWLVGGSDDADAGKRGERGVAAGARSKLIRACAFSAPQIWDVVQSLFFPLFAVAPGPSLLTSKPLPLCAFGMSPRLLAGRSVSVSLFAPWSLALCSFGLRFCTSHVAPARRRASPVPGKQGGGTFRHGDETHMEKKAGRVQRFGGGGRAGGRRVMQAQKSQKTGQDVQAKKETTKQGLQNLLFCRYDRLEVLLALLEGRIGAVAIGGRGRCRRSRRLFRRGGGRTVHRGSVGAQWQRVVGW